MPTILDHRADDALAVRISVTLVDRVHPADLDRPTPCADWNLAALLAHMTAQHHGFAAAAAGHGAAPQAWQVRPVDVDPVTDYARAADEVLAAFAPHDVLARTFALPEFGADVRVPGRLAIGFHLVDYVVHAWDVARSLGAPFDPPVELLHRVLPIAEAVPDGESRSSPGAAFAPRLPTPAGDDPLARILTLLGRSPAWHR